MGKKKPSAASRDAAELPVSTKSKKKSRQVDDDEYSIGTEISDEVNIIKEEEQTVVVSKKKTKGKKGVGFAGLDSLGDEDDADKDVEDEAIEKQKSSKGSKKGSNGGFTDKGSVFDALNAGEDVVGEEEEETVSSSSGKKNIFAAALLDDEEGEGEGETGESESVSVTDIQSKDDEAFTFSSKKKSSKSKKKDSLMSKASIGADVVDESIKESAEKSVDDKIIKQGSVEVVETSKNKKKKKKGGGRDGRTEQEEDDLDKLLAALGEGCLSKPSAPIEEKVELQTEPASVSEVVASGEKEVEGEGGELGESAAAKKKRKKKEKEKEKKAQAVAATVTKEDTKEAKTKAAEKKIPKHVREMQEALARQREAEERLKREEEERLRLEEEKLKREEEEERKKLEAKQRKKEKEKEKKDRLRNEGKLLSNKQKEEAKRLEAMRMQFLANGGTLPTADDGSISHAKKPKYTNKTSKKPKPNPHQQDDSISSTQVNETQSDAVLELPKTEEVESEPVTMYEDVVDTVEQNGVKDEDFEDDVGWEDKSWDEDPILVVPKNAFSEDDEPEPEPEPEPMAVAVMKKEVKQPVSGESKATHSSTKDEEFESNPDQQLSEALVKDKKKEAALKREARTKEALSKRSADNLRSPICCIMGHVDTGKTKLLDCIRGTNVQEGEAGGITQQIGATYFPAENIRERTKELKADATLRVPGLLVIDTPGHESFTNLRSRGSGLCDIAILVVDIMHGLEPQTIESLNLLKMRDTEFIVALNKVDRLYGWKACPNAPIMKAMKQQTKDVQNEFNMRVTQIKVQFMEQGLNTELYYKNKEMGKTYSIIPTSAISGEGIPDLLLLLVQWTSKTMVEKLMFSDEIQCIVLEVKVIEGLGTTIDVILINGILREGDQIVVGGMQEPIVTNIRALLTPHPMKELRVKGSYIHHKELKAAQGVKITAQGLDHAIAGTSLYVVGPEDDLEDIKEAADQDVKSVLNRIDKGGDGVYVQASTLGSLEALLVFLKSPAVNIPVSGISIGPVHKKDVMKASVMLERKKEYATILAFDVKVTPEARELAEESGVKIFIADIIYHLFDQFKAYMDNLKEEKRKEAAEEAVFPCVLQIMPNCVFNKKDPIILGVDVLEGFAKIGTPICLPSREFINIGRITSIEINHKQVNVAKKGQKVAIKIGSTNGEEQQKMFGRHFEMEDELVSHISRKSIDVLKANYREDPNMTNEEWKLLIKLKNLFKIQ